MITGHKGALSFYRPTFAEIDLEAIRHNLTIVKWLVGDNVKVLGVVKADAYGHGANIVSMAIKDYVDYYGVASLDEAAALRKIGIRKPIMILGAILPEEADGVLKFNVTQSVSDINIPKILSKIAVRKRKKVRIHVKVDTGMGRLGFWHEEAVRFIRKISKLENIIIEGIFTHFPNAEEDRVFTNRQIKDFDFIIKTLNSDGIKVPVRHVANSMALIDFKDAHMTMVRPGLMMYGIYPKDELRKNIALMPALSLKTKISHVKRMPKGRTVSYGMTYVTKKDTKVATLSVGYGDGYSRHLSNKADVLIKGIRAPIIGRVCMDMIMADVGHIKGVRTGDEAVLIGRQGNESITAEELAKLANTIPYEIVCNIGRRVPRVYR